MREVIELKKEENIEQLVCILCGEDLLPKDAKEFENEYAHKNCIADFKEFISKQNNEDYV